MPRAFGRYKRCAQRQSGAKAAVAPPRDGGPRPRALPRSSPRRAPVGVVLARGAAAKMNVREENASDRESARHGPSAEAR